MSYFIFSLFTMIGAYCAAFQQKWQLMIIMIGVTLFLWLLGYVERKQGR